MIAAVMRIPAWIYITILVTLGTLVRFINITKASIWHDEGYTMMLAPMPVLEILERTARDVHPPLYYIVLHGWMELFGTSELAARSFSAICLIAAIPLAYLLMRRLFTEHAARVAALFVALGPFLVRYSQEARMYGMVALLLLVATYCLVRANQGGGKRWWLLYALAIAASLYTHYYAIFMIVAHWAYMLFVTRKDHTGLKSRSWWSANVLAAILFLPWLPAAIGQFTRVQGGFWIPEPTSITLPNTLMQLLVFSNGDALGRMAKFGLAIGFIALIYGLWRHAHRYRNSTLLLTLYTLTGPLLVMALSLARPIYIDRYFVFAAVGFYCLLAAIVVLGPPFAGRLRLQVVTVLVAVITFGYGISSVYLQATHQMREVGAVVNEDFRNGDEVISGELYTFFDFSYYNHTSEPTKLYAPNGVNGYGESSLIYDQADRLIIRDLSQIDPVSGFVWMIGKSGNDKPYFDQVPPNWKIVGPKQVYRDSAVQKYRVE